MRGTIDDSHAAASTSSRVPPSAAPSPASSASEVSLDGRRRLLRALDGGAVDRPPVWLMRQAGRYLPGYRAVRERHGFWDVCKTPALSTEVALEPMRLFPLDAAIVFSDILVIPDALGLDVTFGAGDGPRVGRPLRSAADLDEWQVSGVADRLAFVPNAARHLRAALGDAHGILGFAGAPWTLFCYAVEGQGSDEWRLPRTMLTTDPGLARAALDALADAVLDLLRAQIDVGVDAIQLFDTWGGLLTAEDYRAFCLPPLRRIADGVRAAGARSILFVRGGHHLLDVLGDAGTDAVSLDWRTPWGTARRALPTATLQGNLDPVALFAPLDVVRAKTRALLDEMRAANGGGFARTIANLGHGILPGTPPAAVAAFVDEVVRAR